jgi:hypothetical protein
MLLSRVGCGRSGVSLIDIGQSYGVAGDLLDLFGQPLHLYAVLLAGCGHV